jgi:hypothetical protein
MIEEKTDSWLYVIELIPNRTNVVAEVEKNK